MDKFFLFPVAVLHVACSAHLQPPDTISIDSDFSNSQKEIIRVAIGDWCEGVNWCPEETSDTTARGRFVYTYTTGHDSEHGRVIAYNADWRIVVAPGNAGLDTLWLTIAHEVGHWCIPEHMPGLMAEVAEDRVTEIDYRTIRAWKAGCQ